MPARVIRGEINASDSLSRVSMAADLTFRALIVAADDWGRIDGRLPVLRGMLFPLRAEVTERKLDAWLDELAAGDDAPIERYVVDGRPFIALRGWEKHRGQAKRARSSKHPEPPPRRSADLPGILGNPGDPPESRRRETRIERREGEGELEGARGALASAAPPPPAPAVRRSTKIPKPSSFTGSDRERIQEWAAGKGFDRAALNAGLERFREWEPLKTQNRTMAQWVGAFMRIVREGVEDGRIQNRGPAKVQPSAYRSADQVLADARRKAAEDDARAREQASEGERVGKVIELALRQAGGASA